MTTMIAMHMRVFHGFSVVTTGMLMVMVLVLRVVVAIHGVGSVRGTVVSGCVWNFPVVSIGGGLHCFGSRRGVWRLVAVRGTLRPCLPRRLWWAAIIQVCPERDWP